MKRRSFIKNSAGLLLAAPMVVRAESIMRVAPVADYARILEEQCIIDLNQYQVMPWDSSDEIAAKLGAIEIEKDFFDFCLRNIQKDFSMRAIC